MKQDYSNIKNIILDLDNTIIYDKKEYAEGYRNPLKKHGYNEQDYIDIYNSIDGYDKAISEENPYYNRQDMLDFINQDLNKNYSIDVVNSLIDVVGNEWIEVVLLKEETIKYLHSKYNLYIYTNYFQDAQVQRMIHIGYFKYFKGIFGADKYGCKQFKKCFENVLEHINAKPEECIMIGDDKTRDIIAANNVNMKSILFDYNGKRDKKEIDVNNYSVIKDINELKEIL